MGRSKGLKPYNTIPNDLLFNRKISWNQKEATPEFYYIVHPYKGKSLAQCLETS